MFIVTEVNCKDDFYPEPGSAVIDLNERNLHILKVVGQIAYEALDRLKEELPGNTEGITVTFPFDFKFIDHPFSIYAKPEDQPDDWFLAQDLSDEIKSRDEEEGLSCHSITASIEPGDLCCEFWFGATDKFSGDLIETPIINHVDLVEGALDHGFEL